MVERVETSGDGFRVVTGGRRCRLRRPRRRRHRPRPSAVPPGGLRRHARRPCKPCERTRRPRRLSRKACRRGRARPERLRVGGASARGRRRGGDHLPRRHPLARQRQAAGERRRRMALRTARFALGGRTVPAQLARRNAGRRQRDAAGVRARFNAKCLRPGAAGWLRPRFDGVRVLAGELHPWRRCDRRADHGDARSRLGRVRSRAARHRLSDRHRQARNSRPRPAAQDRLPSTALPGSPRDSNPTWRDFISSAPARWRATAR